MAVILLLLKAVTDVAVVVIGMSSIEVMTPPAPGTITALFIPEPIAFESVPVAWLREPMALLDVLLAEFCPPIALLKKPDAALP